jgi:hypothetical protein
MLYAEDHFRTSVSIGLNHHGMGTLTPVEHKHMHLYQQTSDATPDGVGSSSGSSSCPDAVPAHSSFKPIRLRVA